MPRAENLRLLSRREMTVLEMVAQGHTNQDIAARLVLSVKTVETYRARVMDKLALRNRAELVRFAIEQGLLGTKSDSDPQP
jgi:two-component system response regulator NreC